MAYDVNFPLILFLYSSKDDISVALTDLNDRIHSLTFCASARPSIQNVNIAEQQNSFPAVTFIYFLSNFFYWVGSSIPWGTDPKDFSHSKNSFLTR